MLGMLLGKNWFLYLSLLLLFFSVLSSLSLIKKFLDWTRKSWGKDVQTSFYPLFLLFILFFFRFFCMSISFCPFQILFFCIFYLILLKNSLSNKEWLMKKCIKYLPSVVLFSFLSFIFALFFVSFLLLIIWPWSWLLY